MILIKLIHFINLDSNIILFDGSKKYRLSDLIPIQYEEYYSYRGNNYGAS